MCVGATPTLLDLMAMKGADGEPMRVIQTIAAGNYKMFGMYLLKDKNETMVDVLKKNHIHDGVESVTKEILKKWLTSDAPTRTYQHLIQCLRQSELGALAELIRNTIIIKVCYHRTANVHVIFYNYCAFTHPLSLSLSLN